MVEKIEISKGVNLLIGDEPVKLETYGVPTNRTSYFPYLIEIGGPDGYLYYPHYYPSIEIYEKNEDFFVQVEHDGGHPSQRFIYMSAEESIERVLNNPDKLNKIYHEIALRSQNFKFPDQEFFNKEISAYGMNAETAITNEIPFVKYIKEIEQNDNLYFIHRGNLIDKGMYIEEFTDYYLPNHLKQMKDVLEKNDFDTKTEYRIDRSVNNYLENKRLSEYEVDNGTIKLFEDCKRNDKAKALDIWIKNKEYSENKHLSKFSYPPKTLSDRAKNISMTFENTLSKLTNGKEVIYLEMLNGDQREYYNITDHLDKTGKRVIKPITFGNVNLEPGDKISLESYNYHPRTYEITWIGKGDCVKELYGCSKNFFVAMQNLSQEEGVNALLPDNIKEDKYAGAQYLIDVIDNYREKLEDTDVSKIYSKHENEPFYFGISKELDEIVKVLDDKAIKEIANEVYNKTVERRVEYSAKAERGKLEKSEDCLKLLNLLNENLDIDEKTLNFAFEKVANDTKLTEKLSDSSFSKNNSAIEKLTDENYDKFTELVNTQGRER